MDVYDITKHQMYVLKALIYFVILDVFACNAAPKVNREELGETVSSGSVEGSEGVQQESSTSNGFGFRQILNWSANLIDSARNIIANAIDSTKDIVDNAMIGQVEEKVVNSCIERILRFLILESFDRHRNEIKVGGEIISFKEFNQEKENGKIAVTCYDNNNSIIPLDRDKQYALDAAAGFLEKNRDNMKKVFNYFFFEVFGNKTRDLLKFRTEEGCWELLAKCIKGMNFDALFKGFILFCSWLEAPKDSDATNVPAVITVGTNSAEVAQCEQRSWEEVWESLCNVFFKACKEQFPCDFDEGLEKIAEKFKKKVEELKKETILDRGEASNLLEKLAVPDKFKEALKDSQWDFDVIYPKLQSLCFEFKTGSVFDPVKLGNLLEKGTEKTILNPDRANEVTDKALRGFGITDETKGFFASLSRFRETFSMKVGGVVFFDRNWWHGSLYVGSRPLFDILPYGSASLGLVVHKKNVSLLELFGCYAVMLEFGGQLGVDGFSPLGSVTFVLDLNVFQSRAILSKFKFFIGCAIHSKGRMGCSIGAMKIVES